MALNDFWRRFRKPENRDNVGLTVDQYAQLTDSWWNSYRMPLQSWGQPYGKSEEIPNDFVGYANAAYKASGVVFSVSLTRMLIFSEMRFCFQEINQETARPDKLYNDPALDILHEPWENGTTGDLLARAIQDVDLCGNHFAVREDRDGKSRLRRLRPDWVDIVLTEDPKYALRSDIAGYIYKPNKTEDKAKWEVFPVDGTNGIVVHWAPIPDPDAQYRGMSWLTPIVREIQGDKAISKHKLKFFDNAAVPNLVVRVPEGVSMDDFQKVVRVIEEQKTGVDAAYKNLYLGAGADVTVVGSNIHQMDFKSVGGTIETRIAAAGRVHPALVGLSEGLQGSSLNEGNFQAAKDLLVEGFLRPFWRSLCAAYDPLVSEKGGSRLWFDDRDISFLREDRKKVADRQLVESQTIDGYVMNGFTPESAVLAVLHDDLSLLKHTGLYSVQLLPPNISHPEQWGDKNKDGVPDAEENAPPQGNSSGSGGSTGSKTPGSGKKVTGTGQSGANNNPTGSKRKPVGRPPAKGNTS
jgi:phage portal protein BeeE